MSSIGFRGWEGVGRMMCYITVEEVHMPTGKMDYKKLFLHKHEEATNTLNC